MLIQSDPRTGEPLLLSTDLPHSIKSQESSGNVRVLLLDSQMGTGAAASTYLRVMGNLNVEDGGVVVAILFSLSSDGMSTGQAV
jgi:uridine kinase